MGVGRNIKTDNSDEVSFISNALVGFVEKGDGHHWPAIFNRLHSAIILLNEWGQVAIWNDRAEALFNHRDLQGKTLLELLEGWDSPLEFSQEVRDILRRGQPLYGVVEHVVDSESERWFSVDKVPVLGDDGGVGGVLVVFDDISELKLKEAYLHKSEARYRAFIKNNLDAVWRFEISPGIPLNWSDDDIQAAIFERGVLADCNSVFAQLLGFRTETHLVGLSLCEAGISEAIFDPGAFISKRYQLADYEATWMNRSGRQYHLQSTISGTIENNQLVEIWGLSRDNTDRKRYTEKLKYRSTHEKLSGLPNRSKLQSVVSDALSLRKSHQQMALLVLDLDRFKEINNTIGHHIGDRVIQEIGPRLQRVLTPWNGFVAHLGGDEFAIYIDACEGRQQVEYIAERVLVAVREELIIGDLNVEVRASIGAALCPEQAQDFTTLLRYAEVAMYRAKTEMTALEIYDSAFDPHSEKRLQLMGELSKAIRDNQLSLHYQPKISIETGEIVCVEALARWIHPDMGFISPGEFIPIAEMTDAINELTYWVLDESLGQARRWRDQGIEWSVAVNISAKNLLNDSIVDRITAMLDHYQLPTSALELEITESTIMANPVVSMRILEKMKALGIQLSIDDFGTGYSSLAYLKKLAVEYLKIDYSFVINMLEHRQDLIIVRSTINLAHNLGLKVVAEGVENQKVLDSLIGMGCEQAQGYHIAKPMAADELLSWLSGVSWPVLAKS